MMTFTKKIFGSKFFNETIPRLWYQIVVENRFRISGSFTFSLVIHTFIALGYFSLSVLDRPAEPPIREISFIDLTEVEKPKEITKPEPEIYRKPKVVQAPAKPQEVEEQRLAQSDASKPLTLGNERIFMDTPRKQAPINIAQIEPVNKGIDQPKDIVKISPAIGVKKDNKISKPKALDLGQEKDIIIASTSSSDNALSFGQTDRAQIDLQPGNIINTSVEAVTHDLGKKNPPSKNKESLIKPLETQTVITGVLANRQILKKIIPPFPRWAKKQGVGASISLFFTVMENGAVKENVVIKRTSGSLQWDQMVISALKNWQFVPLADKGIREDQTGVITFQFVL
jgi:TonB family protein